MGLVVLSYVFCGLLLQVGRFFGWVGIMDDAVSRHFFIYIFIVTPSGGR